VIILTTPIQVPSQLGSSQTAAYNKLRIVSITSDPVAQTINAQVQLMVQSNPSQPIVSGSLAIVSAGGTPSCVLQVPSLNYNTGVPLTGPQASTVQGWITTLQNNIEAGLVSVLVVAGAQSTGI
jgi:hypothetical protein